MNFKRTKYIEKAIEGWKKTVVEHEATIGTYDVMLSSNKDEMKKKSIENMVKEEKKRLEASHIMLDVLRDMKTELSSLELHYIIEELQLLINAKVEQLYQVGYEYACKKLDEWNGLQDLPPEAHSRN